MNPNSELPWIIFDLNQQLYAISTEMVTGISQMPFITSVAGAPDTYLGVANIRGEVVPILDLKRLLNLSSGEEVIKRVTEELEFKKKGAETYLKEMHRCLEEDERFFATDDIFGEPLNLGYVHEQSEIAAAARNIEQLQEELIVSSIKVNSDPVIAAKVETLCAKLIHTIDSAAAFINSDSASLIITLTNDPESSSTCMGFVVDSVRAVDAINIVNQEGPGKSLFMTQIIGGVAHNDKMKGEILVVDDKKVEETLIGYRESVQKVKDEEEAKKAEKEKKEEKKEDKKKPAGKNNSSKKK